MTRDKTEMKVVENFLSLNKIDVSEPLEIGEWAWRSSPVPLSSENKEILLSLYKEIVTWGQKGVDDVSELLACLLILFSQEAGDSFSNRIGQIFEGWRSVREHWRIIFHLLGFQVHPVAIPGVSTTAMGGQGGAVPRSSGDGGNCS